MKATINQDGMLSIETETELEYYALTKWQEENFINNNGRIKGEKMLFHYKRIEKESGDFQQTNIYKPEPTPNPSGGRVVS